ncbi:MAG: carbamoyltransferase HypF [Deltaproteobacteria bacterium]|nr:carbamoyltransferase HypF [Deltaproteobacteria bacterium]
MSNGDSIRRMRIAINGVVQGVGFRPFIYRRAKAKGLTGFVKNTAEGLMIEVQGQGDSLMEFVNSLHENHPPLASISDIKTDEIPIKDDMDFVIQESKDADSKAPVISPDFSVCGDCLKELFTPSDRRYRYPFINCTNCGPRFTIIKGLPYDRPLTSMASFNMCRDCRREYNNPLDRRFHAEANACPVCGPKVFWAEPRGRVIAEGEDALGLCEDAIRSGRIAAVKGIGGFHLMADAFNDSAARLLRERKIRYEKPLAVIFPPGGDEMLLRLRDEAFLNVAEEDAVLNSERPVVVLKKRHDSGLSKFIAPGLDTLGAFLPYSPLHYLLLNDLNMPLIATSANLSDSPMIKDNGEAVDKLKGIADGFLLHNRDIMRRCDDSVVTICDGKKIFLRRSRGYTPHVLKLPYKLNEPVLAVGGNQKVTIALGWEDKAVMSQHLGDLTTEEGFQAFQQAVLDLTDFYNVKPLRIACDMHPDYFSTRWALTQNGVRHIPVQHHHAHIAACMLDNNLTEKVLGVAWDGTGYGMDGAIWGGEFLIADYKGFERFCAFRKFRLLGGGQAVKEPRRILAAILYEIYGGDIGSRVKGQGSKAEHFKNIFTTAPKSLVRGFTEAELEIFMQMFKTGFNSPFTTSAGRVFDAAGSLLGICHKAAYEGQGAMMLEDMAGGNTGVAYHVEVIREDGINVFNWEPMFKAMLEDVLNGIDIKTISQNFHETLAQLILYAAKMAKDEKGLNAVCLSGGVFQNKVLTERAVNLLKENGFNVYTHNALPPNDGGLSMGQLIIGGLSD